MNMNLTAKLSGASAVALIFTGLLGLGIAQARGSEDERAATRTDELQDLQTLLDLQEQSLELLRQQVQLTRQRIQALTQREQASTMIEIEVQAIEIVTSEQGEFERLLNLPEHGGGFTVVLDSAEYEDLIATAVALEGATVVSRAKVAVHDGVRGEIQNVTEVPHWDSDGELTFEQVGYQYTFRPSVLAEETFALTMDVHGSMLIGDSIVTTPDGKQVTIPRIAERSGHASVRLQAGQGVLLGGIVAMRSPPASAEAQYTYLLYFARPRILAAAELGEF